MVVCEWFATQVLFELWTGCKEYSLAPIYRIMIDKLVACDVKLCQISMLVVYDYDDDDEICQIGVKYRCWCSIAFDDDNL